MLDEKLAEVLGLAQAAQTATTKVATLARKEKETELVEAMQHTVREHSLRLAADQDPGEAEAA